MMGASYFMKGILSDQMPNRVTQLQWCGRAPGKCLQMMALYWLSMANAWPLACRREDLTAMDVERKTIDKEGG